MDVVCQEALLPMVLQNALEKGVVLLIVSPLHVDTVLHLQSVPHAGPTLTVEEMLMQGIAIGIQATEVTQSAPHKDVTEAHHEEGVPPDTNAEEAEAGVRLAAQVLTMVVTGSAAGVQCVVQVLQITDLP